MKTLSVSKKLTTGLLLALIGVNAGAQVAQPIKPTVNPTAAMLKTLSILPKEVIQKKLGQYLAGILVNPMKALDPKTIGAGDIKDLAQQSTTKEEMAFLKTLGIMADNKTLAPAIDELITKLGSGQGDVAQQIKALNPQQLAYAKGMFQASIEATVRLRGLTNDSSKAVYLEWDDLSNRMLAKIKKSTSPNLLEFAKTSWVRTADAQILVDGVESFKKRYEIIDGATKSINILTWSIYDDGTGEEIVNRLIKIKNDPAKKDVKIRVVVDGQVARTGVQVKRLEDAGIEVIRWFSTSKPYAGQHRKMIIVDNDKMVAGGLNFGDVYSHRIKTADAVHWRDTDIFVRGSGAAQANALFTEIWNQQRSEQKLNKLVAIPKVDVIRSASDEKMDVAIIDHNVIPQQEGSTIMMTLLKAINKANSRIDIENAYIILFPALKSELKAAIDRGVKVRVYTNSGTSVDEPIVTIPILRSVQEFAEMKAEVFVKKGTTLHSKLMMVDGLYTMVMSYNLHPRSERVEGEMMIVVKDSKFTQNMHTVFDNDVTSEKADVIRAALDVKLPASPAALPTLRVFFDML